MRRKNLFLILTVVSLASLVAVVIAGYYVLSTSSSQYPYNWMGQMIGGVMGGGSGAQVQVQNAAAPYLGVAFVVLVGVAVVSIGGLIYFFAFPEIRAPRAGVQPFLKSIAQSSDNSVSAYDSVVKTLNADERKVVEVLTAHEGKYLQKYIRNEAGLSMLQTYRVVARLAERGVVTLEKTGNTNMVLLADWLHGS
jgi:hypothetical protein